MSRRSERIQALMKSDSFQKLSRKAACSLAVSSEYDVDTRNLYKGYLIDEDRDDVFNARDEVDTYIDMLVNA